MIAALLVAGAGVADAQTSAIGAAKRAAAATDAHIAREQDVQAKTQSGSQTHAVRTTAKPAPGAARKSHAPAAKPGTTAKAAADTALPVVMRETFTYDRAGARDPFVSLLNTSELRPVISDLRLVGVLYDPSGRRSVAVMRDKTNQLYRATIGQTLGRMRVARITPRAVYFTIEEFGFNRTDSLVLADTTLARIP